MMDEGYIELVKLANHLSTQGIPISTALRFFRTMLENDPVILNELKVIKYVKEVFRKRFLKRVEVPDLIAEDNTIAVEVKSFNKNVSLENAVRLWRIPCTEIVHYRNLTP